MTVLLADISEFQGVMDWQKAELELDGIWIRATQGVDDIDDRLHQNVAGSEGRNLYRGFYHVYKSNYTGIEQGKFFIDRLPALYNLPPVIDVEIPDTVGNFTEYERRLRELLLYVEVHTQMRPLIYTSKNFWESNLGNSLWASQYELWVANYGDPPPLIPDDWSEWLLWQYTESANGPSYGASSPSIDLNHFNGNRREFEYWVRKVNSGKPMPREKYLKWTVICPPSVTLKQKQKAYEYARSRGRTLSFSYDAADWGVAELVYLDSSVHHKYINWFNLHYPHTKVVFSTIGE